MNKSIDKYTRFINGSIQNLFSKPARRRKITMAKPYGSILENVFETLTGNSPSKTLPPSSGGIGNRLTINKRMLIKTPNLQISLITNRFVGYKISKITKIDDQKIA